MDKVGPTPGPVLPRCQACAGNRHALTLPELQRRYAHVPPAGLQLALATLLRYRQGEPPQPAAQGLTSLLEAGVLGALLRQPEGAGALPAGAAAAGAAGRGPGPAPPPAWLRPFHRCEAAGARPALPQRLLLREAGASASARSRRGLLPVPEQAGEAVRGAGRALRLLCGCM